MAQTAYLQYFLYFFLYIFEIKVKDAEPTIDDCYEVETTFMLIELTGGYKKVYDNGSLIMKQIVLTLLIMQERKFVYYMKDLIKWKSKHQSEPITQEIFIMF